MFSQYSAFLGLGKTGLEMVNTLQETDRYGLRLMAADWRRELRTAKAEKKFQLRKNTDPKTVVEALSDKLSEALTGCDLLFLRT